MKLTDLKSPYRELAEMRREKKPHPYNSNFKTTNDLEDAFWWVDTPEEVIFWDAVYGEESPPIPQSSLDELSEWQKGKEPKKSLADAWNEGRLKTIQMLNGSQYDRPNIDEAFCVALNPYDNILNKIKVPEFEPTAIIESPDHRLFTVAVAAMQGLLSNPEYMTVYKGEKYIMQSEIISEVAVEQAQALLTELNKVK